MHRKTNVLYWDNKYSDSDSEDETSIDESVQMVTRKYFIFVLFSIFNLPEAEPWPQNKKTKAKKARPLVYLWLILLLPDA